MIKPLRKLFQPRPTLPLSAVPPGERVYAIGDIQYVSLVARIPSVLVVNAKSGIDSLEALLKKAKAEYDAAEAAKESKRRAA